MRQLQSADLRIAVRSVLGAALLCGAPSLALADQAEATPFGEEEYRVYAFDSWLFAGVVAGVYGKPLTYGLTVSWRFGAGYQ